MSDSEYSDTDYDDQPKRTTKAKGGNKRVEDIYKKTNLREHILNRPDSYIGTIEMETEKLFVMEDGASRFTTKEVTYAPGLLKIFDEILVNAADNKQRDPKGMTRLEVVIDQGRNLISVFNNGMGIPVSIHQEYGIYVPELIFGQLLTSSNYDDSEKRTVGGRNGFGAKLANIFSKQFIVESHDQQRRLTYKQIFSNNMVDKTEPSIVKGTGPSWTRITFQPDLQRFNMTTLDDDIVLLLKKRVYDIAGTCGKGLDVYLNGELLKIKDFKEYCKLYFHSNVDVLHDVINDRWEVIVAPSDGQFTQVSFVNRINTLRGGTHVNAIADQCVKTLTDVISKKNKKITLRPQHFRNHMWIFVNSLVENPTFDTQTKVNLTTRRTALGDGVKLSEKFNKALAKSSLVASILEFATFQQNRELKKSDAKKKTSRLLGIPKLEDANKAGTRESKNCTLIITEGDSAKSLAMAGLSIVGRDYFGVFPIRGKLLNVREATAKQIVENQEITNLKKIIGLQQNRKYESTADLRYGHIMIMTDQDHDGSHIKGLIINMFATFWPSLLKIPGFLVEFITPIVKVTRKSNPRQIQSFYTIPEYETWKENVPNPKAWRVKYYKGLGSSTSAEAKEYFADINHHRIEFEYENDECFKLVEMAFSRTAVNDRKVWLQNFVPGTFLDQAVEKITYQDFINKELILFSIASNQRAIPSLVDGLKPGQRKVLFACFKRDLKTDLKVQQLAGYVAENAAYHHGDVSLAATIVNLAQNYVGTNNINYLWPSGQFGTRSLGGKDAASARYISTHLSPVTRSLFHRDDDSLLNYLNDDGQSIEPEYYVPILPTVLVNGSSGIGTGWSSDIPNHNPRDIVENIRRMLRGDEPQDMHPYYKGYIGELALRGRRGTYFVRGLIDEVDDKPNTVHIYELPIGKWTSDYKTWLESLTEETKEQKNPPVTEIMEYHTDVTVSFVVTLTDDAWSKAKEDLRAYFKLETSLSTSNMVLFNAQGQLQRYDSAVDILKEFYPIRYQFYEKRKAFILNTLGSELKRIDNKVKFILAVINDEIRLRNIKQPELLAALERLGLDKIYKDETKSSQSTSTNANDDDDDEEDESGDESGYEDDDGVVNLSTSKGKKPLTNQQVAHKLRGYSYLTSMPLLSLTYEKVQELLREKGDKEAQINELQNTTIEQLWSRDLDAFEEELCRHEDKEQEELRAGEEIQKRNKRAAARAGGGRSARGKSFDDDSDDDDSDDGWGPGSKKKKRQPASSSKKQAKNVASVPSYVEEINRLRAKMTQQFIIEEETDKERKRREKQESKQLEQFDSIKDVLGLGGMDDTDSTTTTTASQKKTKTAAAAKKTASTTKKSTKAATASTTAKGRGGRKKSEESDFESDISDMDDDDDAFSDFMGDSDSEDEYMPSKPKRTTSKAKSTTTTTTTAKASSTTAGTRKRKAAAITPIIDSDDDYDDDDSDYDAPVKPKTSRAAGSRANSSVAASSAGSATSAFKKMCIEDDNTDDYDDPGGSSSGNNNTSSSSSSAAAVPRSLSLPAPAAPRPLTLAERLAQKSANSSSAKSILSYLDGSSGSTVGRSSSLSLPPTTSTSTSSLLSSLPSSSLTSSSSSSLTSSLTSRLKTTSSGATSNTITSLGQSILDGDSDDDNPPAKKTTTTKRTTTSSAKRTTSTSTAPKRTTSSKKKADDDYDDDDDDDMFDPSSPPPPARSARGGTRRAATAAPKYIIDSSDDDDDDGYDDDYSDYSD